MSWHRSPLAAFDLETSGVDTETCRIVTATVAVVNDGPVRTREWLVNPGVPIPAEATAVHGVTDEQAQTDGIDPGEAVAEIWAALDDAWSRRWPVVIYNAAFDLTLLDRELRRHRGMTLDGRLGTVFDPLVVDKAMDPYRKGKRTLTAAAAHYGVRLEGAHTSAGDALAAARVAWRLVETYPQLADLDALTDQQAQWRAEQSASLQDYFRRSGKANAVVDGAWPYKPLQREAAVA